jgi:endoglucanase
VSGYARVSGQQLVDGTGAPLHLRGVNLGTWLLQEPWAQGGPPSSGAGMTFWLNRLATVIGQPATDQFRIDYQNTLITQADVQAIAGYGFNVLRVSFNARYLSEQLPLLDNVIGWARTAGLYVVLDMHAAQCSQNPYLTSDAADGTAALWYKAGCKAQAVSVWQTIAARYANEPTVLGYDLLNEPDGLSMSNAALFQMYQQMITGIRSVDPNHVVIVEGRSFTHDNAAFTAPLDPNLMLALHQYVWDVDGTNLSKAVTNAEQAAGRLGGVPVWVGEMGLDNASATNLQVSTYDADPAICGWAYWTWKMAARTDVKQALNQYVAPASWVSVAAWMANKAGAVKPTVAQAKQGIADYLTAIGQTTVNTAVLDALTG